VKKLLAFVFGETNKTAKVGKVGEKRRRSWESKAGLNNLRQIQCLAAGPRQWSARGGAFDMRTGLRGVFAALCIAVLVTFAVGLFTPTPAAKSPSTRSSVHKQKKVGSSEVRTIQKALNLKGYKVKVNGKMDKPTRAAIKKFQSDHGLEATGRVDEDTLAELGIG
jgi:hypothetical protein